jgi:glycosyltransferase involved in cell wall biosynthesis/SAM-dependent methyltransferase
MSDHPLVSVVIPCYNQARSIESVLAQSYPRIEVMVVDDGSTDPTAEVAARYPEVHYVRQENRGLAAARNTGMHESRGEVLVFLDADDRLLPGAVERGIHHLAVSPESAFVSGRYRYIREDGSVLREYSQEPAGQDPYASFLMGNYVGMHATVAYRREPIESEGGFNPSLPACEDYDLYLRIARKYPVSAHKDLVAEYRQHSQNMSRDPELMLKTVLAVLKSNWPYAREQKVYRKAYRAGVKAWQEHYSRAFFDLAAERWSSGQQKEAVRYAKPWLRYAPRQFAAYAAWIAAGAAVHGVRRVLPVPVHHYLAKRRGAAYIPPKGKVRLGDLRRLTPVSRVFGYERGLPVDRYYIEAFLARRADDIRGRVLEVGDDSYMRKFGGARVTRRDILHVSAGNPAATIVADLAHADHIPANLFDCIILTQTLHLVYHVGAAVETLCRILKPGGVLLATFPGISQISIDEWSKTWYWSFTVLSAQRLFEEVFPVKNVEVGAYGNVLAATAFLQGLAAEELSPEELDYVDPQYPALITVRAVKPDETVK